jgi:hypothetical protein
MSKNLTFTHLLDIMKQRVGQPGMPSIKSLENANSALRGFVRAQRLDLGSKVGRTLRDDFEVGLDAYASELRRQELKPPTVNNKTPLLEQWRCLVRTLDNERANELGQRSPFLQKIDELYATRSDMPKLVIKAGISRGQMRQWRKHERPPFPKSAPKISRLSVLSGLGPNGLLDLLPADFRCNEKLRAPAPKIEWRENLKEMMKDQYLLKPAQWSEPLRLEWAGVKDHKVPTGDPRHDLATGASSSELANGNSSSAEQARERARDKLRQLVDVAMSSDVGLNGDPWRVRPVGDYLQRFPSWVNVVGENICPSAGTTFSACQAFLGWALKPEDGGGPKLPEKKKLSGDKELFAVNQLTLGLLADTNLLEQFLRWRVIRSIGVNGWFFSFLNIVKSLLREKTGYLWRSNEIGARVGASDETAWRQQCAATVAWAEQKCENFKPLRKKTRKLEALEPLLDMERPLAGFREGIQLYAGVRRRPHWAHAQSRNLGLLAVSISNPVRLTNLRLATYKEDNTGHFRKDSRGAFWLHIPREEFKNIDGAAKNRDYAQPLSPLAAQYLTAYLENHWPGRDSTGRGLVFVSQRSPNHLWRGMDDTYAQVTRQYMRGNVGFRPHSTRYLVGSAILMASHGNIDLAALALHDMPSTVVSCYKVLLASFAARGVSAAIGIDMASDDDLADFVSARALASAAEAAKLPPGRDP